MILVMYSNFEPTVRHIERLSLLSNMPVHVVRSEDDALALAPRAEIILGHRYLHQTLKLAEKVRWVQSTAAGMDQIITPILKQRAPLLTRSTVASQTVALHALTMAFALVRRLPAALASQREGKLTRPEDLLPLPRKAVVWGMGEIGIAIARQLRAVGMTVTGVARTAGKARESACDCLVTGEEWQHHLHDADLLFLALSLTQDTQGIIDARIVSALPRHAVIVNVGRGALLDWPVLSEALLSGRIGGLAVDAVDNLPYDAQGLLHAKSFLLTPKMAALQPGFQDDIETYIETQMERYARHEPLLNVVNYMDDA